MSELIVEIVKIKDITNHPNADRLDLATIKGWQCVIAKDSFKKGDKVVYLPIDSILPFEIENKIFPPESKIKLTKSRIRTIKIRGAISQGMIVPLKSLGLTEDIKIGTDVKEKLGILKYDPPPQKGTYIDGGVSKVSKKQKNPHFKKYTNIDHVKNYPETMKNLNVIITEKIHGSNYRGGYVKIGRLNIWKRFLKLFSLVPEYEFVFGSHNVQLQGLLKHFKKTFYKTNIYLDITKQYNLEKKLKPYEVIYAEIYGFNLQKNYSYGCKQNEFKMVVIDVMICDRYLNKEDAIQFCVERDLPFAPVLYKGIYSQEVIDKYVDGKSVLAPKYQPVREGIVITTMQEQITHIGRGILKYINPKYLLKDQSEWH